MKGSFMPRVTVGFVPRDRFSPAAECLRRLFECTQIPFQLILVDGNTPRVHWRQIERELGTRENVKIIHANHYLSSNQARNLVLRETRTEFLCIIENEVIVQDRWLSGLLAACDEHPADVALPLFLEPHGPYYRVHFNRRMGHIMQPVDENGCKVQILPGGSPCEADRTGNRRTLQLIETHCNLFRVNAIDRLGLFDESLGGAQAHVDMSLALYEHGVPIVLEPKVHVTLMPPPPIHPEERDFFLRYWNLEKAIADKQRIEDKWNLVECDFDVGFFDAKLQIAEDLHPDVQMQRHAERFSGLFEYLSLVKLAEQEVSGVVPAQASIILVDNDEWGFGQLFWNYRIFPFAEENGQYWGPPTDDETAVREFKRLQQSGASFIVFGWPAFWWLDYYQGLNRHLRSSFRCVLHNDRLVVFDLRS